MDPEHAEHGGPQGDPELYYLMEELYFEIFYVEHKSELLAFGTDLCCQSDSRHFRRRSMPCRVRTRIQSTEGGPLFDIHRLHDFAGYGILPVEAGEEAQQHGGG